MGQLYLPPRSPIVKAARGWPSSLNSTPLIPIKFNWGGKWTKGTQFFMAAGGAANNARDLAYGLTPTPYGSGTPEYGRDGVTLNGCNLQYSAADRLCNNDSFSIGAIIKIPSGGSETSFGSLNGENGSLRNIITLDAYGTPYSSRYISIQTHFAYGGAYAFHGFTTPGSFFSDNDRLFFTFSYDQSTIRVFLKNLTTGATHTATNTDESGVLTGNTEYGLIIGGAYSTFTTTAFAQIVESVFIKNYGMLEAEFREIGRDYYGSFLEPANQSPYPYSVPDAVGGIPNLSAADMINLTPNCFEPQVQVTF